MNITLPPEQQKWLEAEIKSGRFTSIEDALATAVGELMASGQDDLEWARPYIEQARASVARGDVISGDEFFRRLAHKLTNLQ
jgi:Arc/MetJ-type ribon-helix-helix transcriptional regulator